MLIFFGILILLACVFLGLFVLIQNPKGGGLAGTFGGLGNQIMGVRQTTDVLEKGTWVLAGIIALLCLTSVFFIPKNKGTQQEKTLIETSGNLPAAVPATPVSPTPPAALPAGGNAPSRPQPPAKK